LLAQTTQNSGRGLYAGGGGGEFEAVGESVDCEVEGFRLFGAVGCDGAVCEAEGVVTGLFSVHC